MAIPSSFSPFRPSRSTSHASNVVQHDQLAGWMPQTGVGKQVTARDVNGRARNRRMSIDEHTSHTQSKSLEKKNTFKFFRRLSTRFSSKTHQRRTNPMDPIAATTSEPIPSVLLNKTTSNDPVLTAVSTPIGRLSSQSTFHTAPKTTQSLSCDETGSLYSPKDLAKGSPSDTQCSKKSPSRASKLFRKRLSLSSSLVVDGEQGGPMKPEVNGSYVEEEAPVSFSSDDHLSSIMSSELSSANETGETSLASTDDEADAEECGLAGIGVRNRMSICLHSLPIRPGVTSQIATPKPFVHPAMRYAPSSSSPLSSRLAPPLAESHSSITNNRPPSKRYSSQSYVSRRPPSSLLPHNDRRMSYGHMVLVPNQTSVDSETLMRILRGPSSYPDETLPRASTSHRDSLYVTCA